MDHPVFLQFHLDTPCFFTYPQISFDLWTFYYISFRLLSDFPQISLKLTYFRGINEENSVNFFQKNQKSYRLRFAFRRSPCKSRRPFEFLDKILSVEGGKKSMDGGKGVEAVALKLMYERKQSGKEGTPLQRTSKYN